MKKITFIVLSLMVVLAACEGLSGYKKAKSGLQYKIVSKGKGAQLKKGQFVKASLKIYLRDSVLYDSYENMPYYSVVDSLGQPYDYSELLSKLVVGDSLIIIQSVDTFLKKGAQMPPVFKKGDKIKSYMKVLEVFNDQNTVQADYNKYQQIAMDKQKKKAEESLKNETVEIEKHLSKNNIKAEKKGAGVYVETIKIGNGPIADSGKLVGVYYTGKLFDGTVFDSNRDTSFKHTDTLKFVVDQGGMIKGFNDGLKNLPSGSIVKIYIPSPLGYGAQSNGKIPANAKLIFEAEIVSVNSLPAPQPMPNQPKVDTKKK